MWGLPVSPHLSSSRLSQICSETLWRNSLWDSYSLPLRSGPARLIMLSIAHETQILPSADFYFLTVSEWGTKTNILDGLLAKFISTKNQTHHHFFLMVQVIPDQDLQIHRAHSPHHVGRLKCQLFSLLHTLSCSPGARFMITLSVRCGLCII